MPLFKITKNKVHQLRKQSFKNERALQLFVEENLQTLFNVRFVSSEHETSSAHGGRIDTLGIDENNAPVIIEYKSGETGNIINQGLFYLDWLVDHHGDFQLLAQKVLEDDIEIDFGAPRLLLIAASFTHYDQYAINRMAENIELWTYSLYGVDILELRLFASSHATNKQENKQKITHIRYKEYSVEQHLKNKSKMIRELFNALRERILQFEGGQKIEENPRKKYIVYRTNKNFVELVMQAKGIKIYIDVPLKELDDIKGIGQDVSNVGRYGTGETKIILKNFDDLEYIVGLIAQSYKKAS